MYFSCVRCYHCSHKCSLISGYIYGFFLPLQAWPNKNKRQYYRTISPIFQKPPPPGFLASPSLRDLMLGGFLLWGLLLWGLLLPAGLLAGDSRRRILHSPGDFILGGLFPMHEQVKWAWEWKKKVGVNIQTSDLIIYSFVL